ncbi:unnamed protein product, partial [Trichobilharzia regenti]
MINAGFSHIGDIIIPGIQAKPADETPSGMKHAFLKPVIAIGIACQIGFAFSLINTRYLFTSMLKYAFDWISERLVNIDQIVFYHQHSSTEENNISDINVRVDSRNESVHRQVLYRLVSKYG